VGTWSVKITIDDDGIDAKAETIFSQTFLVLPSEMTVTSKLNEGEEFKIGGFERNWAFGGICVGDEFMTNFDSKRTNSFKNCQKTARWSSFYPDPKSDLLSKI